MKIEFYHRETGDAIPKHHTDDWYFVMNDKVYKDSGDFFESQEATVSFDTFAVPCPAIKWRVVAA